MHQAKRPLGSGQAMRPGRLCGRRYLMAVVDIHCWKQAFAHQQKTAVVTPGSASASSNYRVRNSVFGTAAIIQVVGAGPVLLMKSAHLR